jgi:hypothetical protein
MKEYIYSIKLKDIGIECRILASGKILYVSYAMPVLMLPIRMPKTLLFADAKPTPSLTKSTPLPPKPKML